ncbi:hypothetical protein AB0K18_47995 [Nonomuraea sp. NPDC049421]|uniref:hypothetical protein n=1 Tax=Nonomuraea sp. NPDC049421 TaxID=3155275 RepID=UPI00344AD580
MKMKPAVGAHASGIHAVRGLCHSTCLRDRRKLRWSLNDQRANRFSYYEDG